MQPDNFSTRSRTFRNRLTAVLATLGVVTTASGLLMATAQTASAHVPGISASCAGVHLTGSDYDETKANTWTVTINGQTQSGTFAGSLDKTFPVAQNGATSTWKATVQAYNGYFRKELSGTVGPCGDVQHTAVSLCHFTSENASHRYNFITVDDDAVVKAYGHGGHAKDIIPAFDYYDNGNLEHYPGKNLDKLGWIDTAKGACEEPPVDVCEDLSGDQPAGTQCTPPADQVDVDVKKETVCETGQVVTTTVTETTPYVFDRYTNTWKPGKTVTTTETSHRNATAEELDEAECAGPEKPDAIVQKESSEHVDCDADEVVTTTTTTTTDWVYDADDREWVKDEPVVTTTTAARAATGQECPTATTTPPAPEGEVQGTQTAKPRPRPADQPTVKGVEATALPTAVDAGLAGVSAAQGTTTQELLAQLLVGGGLLLLVGAAWTGLGRRDRGGHQV